MRYKSCLNLYNLPRKNTWKQHVESFDTLRIVQEQEFSFLTGIINNMMGSVVLSRELVHYLEGRWQDTLLLSGGHHLLEDQKVGNSIQILSRS